VRQIQSVGAAVCGHGHDLTGNGGGVGMQIQRALCRQAVGLTIAVTQVVTDEIPEVAIPEGGAARPGIGRLAQQVPAFHDRLQPTGPLQAFAIRPLHVG